MFLKATLGLEAEVLREAVTILGEAETRGAECQNGAQRQPEPSQASAYPPGTEYALIVAEAQLMNAVLSVLNESLTEGIKGFYKLKKAYGTLNGIMESQQRYADRCATTGSGTTSTGQSTPATPDRGSGSEYMVAGTEELASEDDDVDDEFVDAVEEFNGATLEPSASNGKPRETDTATPNNETEQKAEKGKPKAPPPAPLFLRAPTGIDPGPDPSLFQTNLVDEFIHTGSNLCLGVVNVMISIVPPALSAILKVVGFRGDRDRGLSMLWQVAGSRRNNIHAALAGLVLCSYYNIVLGSCDVVAAGSFPRESCQALLAEMRARFPRSRLWLLEQARALALERKLDDAVRLISEQGSSPLKQVEALQCFERSIYRMYAHDYAGCSEGFLWCVKVNKWSHALYYYMAGAAKVEMYREAKRKCDEEGMERHAKEATELIRKVPGHSGKKRFMAKQLPFDVFVSRKVAKWEERSKSWGVPFVDAIGVSPLEEMVFFWNGYKRMSAAHLQQSLATLAWSESDDNALWDREGLDEHAVLALLRAATLRNLRRTDEARRLITEEILAHEWRDFKGGLRDSWTCPVARYELAMLCFQESEGLHGPEKKAKLQECLRYLEIVAGWESYDLDARIGMRVTSGREILKKSGVVEGACME